MRLELSNEELLVAVEEYLGKRTPLYKLGDFKWILSRGAPGHIEAMVLKVEVEEKPNDK